MRVKKFLVLDILLSLNTATFNVLVQFQGSGKKTGHHCLSSKKLIAVNTILDFAEFEIDAPTALSLNTMTYSHYKGQNTVKVLFAVIPECCISQVSSAYPRSINDNVIMITSNPGILDLFQPDYEIFASNI